MLFTSLCQCVGGFAFAFYYSWSMVQPSPRADRPVRCLMPNRVLAQTLVMLGTAPLMGVAVGIQGKLTVTFTKKASDSSAIAVAVAEEVPHCIIVAFLA